MRKNNKPGLVHTLAATIASVALTFSQISPFLLMVPTASGATFSWNQTAVGTYVWPTSAFWTPTGFPNAIGDIANLTNDITGDQTINLNQVITLGTLNLGDSNGSNIFTLAGGTGGYLLLDVSSGSTVISKAVGANANDVISTGIQFNDALAITNASPTGSLTLSGGLRSLTSDISFNGAGAIGVSTAGLVTAGNFVKNDGGTTTLSIASTYAGSTAINGGNLLLGIAAATPVRSAVTVAAGATLNYGDFGAVTIGSLAGSGTVTNNGVGTTRTLSIGRDDTSTVFSGTFTKAANFNRLAITKIGSGTLTLASTVASNYTGTTSVNGGTLLLDFTAGSLTSMLAATPLDLGGGTFSVKGKSGSAISQTLGNFTISAGGGSIVMDANGSVTGTLLKLGTISSTAVGGSVLVNSPANTKVQFNQAMNTATTINGRIVFTDGANFNWAANTGVNTDTIGFSTYTDVAGTALATTNALNDRIDSAVVNQTTTLTAGGSTTNSLKINSGATGQSLTLVGNNLTLTNGGLLFTGSNAYTISSTTGALRGESSADLKVHQYGSGDLTISAIIGDNTAATGLTKDGTGKLILSGTNTYTGVTTIAGGTLSISANTHLGGAGTGALINIADGGTLQNSAASLTLDNAGLNKRNVVLLGGTATIDPGAGNTLTITGDVTGAGNLVTAANSGILVLSGAGTAYTGSTTLGAGSTLRAGVANVLSSSSPVTLGAGATFDLNALDQAIGSLSGSGIVKNSTTAAILTVGASNLNTTFTGTFTGALANDLIKTGSGILTIASPSTSAWTGGTSIKGGVLRFGANAVLNSTGTITIANAAGPSQLDLNGFLFTSAAITFGGTTGTSTSQGNLSIGTGTLTLGGNVTYTATGNPLGASITASGAGGVAMTAVRTFTIDDSAAVPSTAAELTVAAVMSGTNGGVTKAGAGNLLLSGANSYTGLTTVSAGSLLLTGNNTLLSGGTTVNGGTLVLNYTADNNTKISTGGALTLGGGVLLLNGNAGANTVQSVGSTIVSAGYSTLTLLSGGAQSATLNLGAMSRNSSAGVVRFNPPVSGGFTTTATNNLATSMGILGGWAIINTGSTSFFARNDGANNIVASNVTAQDNVALWVAGDNVTDSAGYTGTTVAPASSVNSIRFNSASASTVTIGNNNVLAITTGGVLLTPNVVAGNASIAGGFLAGSSAANELIFTSDNSANPALTVTSRLIGATAVTVAGSGTVLLNSAGNFNTGTVALQGGTLQVVGGNALGDNAPVVFGNSGSNPTLKLAAAVTETIGNLSGGGTSGGLVDLGAGSTLTVNQTGATTYSGTLTGSGTLIKSGASGLTFQGASGAAYTGPVLINQGRLALSGSASLTGVTAYTLNGGELLDTQDGTAVDRIGNSAVLTLNNTGGGFGLYFNTSTNASRVETIGKVVLNAGQNVITVDATGGASAVGGLLTTDVTTGLARNGNATALVRGRALGASAGQHSSIRFAAGTGPTLVGGAVTAGTTTIGIVPYLIGETTTGSPAAANVGNSFVTNTGATDGLRALVLTSGVGAEYIFNQAGYNAMAASTQNNVRFTTNSGVLTAVPGTRTINALAIDSTSAGVAVTGPASDTLALTAGAILSTGAAANNTSLSGFAGITTGTGEYVVFVNNNTFTISSTLTTAAASLTKAGAGALVLNGLSNSYTLGTNFNQGIIESDSLAGLGSGGLKFFGGTLRWASASSFDASASTITLGLGGGTFDTNGNSVTFANGIGNAGAGGLSKAGLGTLTLNGAANYTGLTTVSAGTLAMGITNAIGGGALTVSGGSTLSMGGFNATVAGLTLSAAANSMTGSGILTVNGDTTLNQGTIDPVLAGSTNLIKATTGLTAGLNNTANTYTGFTWVQAGTLSVAALANAGANSSIGAATGNNSGILLGQAANAGTLLYAGTGAGSTNRPFLLSGSTGGAIIDSGSAAAGLLTLNGGAYGIVTGSKTLTLQGSNGTTGAPNIYAGAIGDGVGIVGVTKSGAGVWALNGANTYTGATTVTAGVLNVGSLANGGVVSSIGAATNAATNLLLNGGTLSYTGGAASTDRLFSLQASSTLDASGSGAINFNNAGVYATPGTASARTLTLSGSNTGANTLGGIIQDSGVNPNITSLTKTGAGTWVLGNANTFTGATIISAGVLRLGNANAVQSSAVTVSATNGLAFSSGIGTFNVGSLAGAADFVLTDNAAAGVTLVEGSNNTSTAFSGIIGGASGALQKVGSGTLTLSGVNTFGNGLVIKSGTVSGTTSASAFGAGTITLGDTTGSANAILSGGFAGPFANAITVAAGSSGTATITNSAVTIFGGPVTLNKNLSLVSTTTFGLTLTGGFTGTGNLIIAGTGTTGAVTISTGSVNNTGTLTNQGTNTGTTIVSSVIGGNVTGVIQNSSTSQMTLSGPNTYAGPTTINAGILSISASNNLGNSSVTNTISISGGKLQNTGAAVVLGTNRTVAVGAAGATFDVTSTNSLTVDGVVSGSTTLTKTGTGTLVLTGTNTFNGSIVVNGGTLSTKPGSIATASSLVVGTTVSSSLDLYADTIAATANLASGTSITLGGASTSGGLGFQLGAVASPYDNIVLSGGGTLTVNAGGGLINVSSLPGFGAGTYTLISGASSITGDTNLALGSLPSGFIYLLSTDATSVKLIVAGAASGNLYWAGDVSNSWNVVGNTNWSTSPTATTPDPGSPPGPAATVTFSVTTGAANYNTALNSAFSILGLNFTGDTPDVSIAPGGGGTLTIGAGGITVAALTTGGTSMTISAPVILGATQSWNVASGRTLDLTSTSTLNLSTFDLSLASAAANGTTGITISGAISGSGNVNVTGPGTVALRTSASTMTGNWNISNGELNIDADSRLGDTASGTRTVNLTNGGSLVSSGAFTLGANRQIALGTGGGTLRASAAANSLTLATTGQLTGTTQLTLNGVGTVVINAANVGFTGDTVLRGRSAAAGAGKLTLGATGAVNGNVSASATNGDNATINYNANGAATSHLISLLGDNQQVNLASGVTDFLGDTFSIAGSSVIVLSSLTNPVLTSGANVTFATNAVVAESIAGAVSTRTVLLNDNRLFFGIVGASLAEAATINVGATGATTPFKGISSGALADATLSGAATINAVSDFTLQGLNGNTLTLGANGASNVTISAASAVNASILGGVTLNNSATGSISSNVTFQVQNGGTLTVARLGALGSGVNTAAGINVLSGGTLTPTTANALNTPVTIQAQGILTANNPLTGTGAITLNTFARVNVTNANGLTGAQLPLSSIVAGIVVRMGVDNISNINLVNPGATFSATGTRTENLGINLNGGVLTQSNATGTFTSSAGIAISGLGGTIAASSTTSDKIFTINTGTVISGTGPLTINSSANIDGVAKAGIVRFGSGLADTTANTFSGLTTVVAGTLQLNKAVGTNAIAGDITLSGTPTGVNAPVITLLAGGNQISDTSKLLIQNGTFNMNTFNETVGSFRMTGGTVTGSGSSTLTAAADGLIAVTGGTVANNLVTSNKGILIGDAIFSGTLTLAANSASMIVPGGGPTFDVITGSGSLTDYSSSQVTLSANNSGFTGLLTVASRGSSTATTAQIVLAAATGNAIGGDLKIGNGSLDFNGHATVELDAANTNFNQIKDTAFVRFDAREIGSTDRNAYFKMMGTSETIAGILDSDGRGVIETMEDEVINSNSVLTLAGTADSFFNGFLRNRGTSTGTGTMALNKSSTSGTLTLSGSNITFTGGLTSAGGKLILRNVTSFGSALNLTDTALELDATAAMTFNDAITLSGTSTITKTGASTLTLDRVYNFNKVFTALGGGLTLNKAMTFSNGLALSRGTNLIVNAAAAGMTINGGLTQIDGGNGTAFNGAFTVNGGATFADTGGDSAFDDVDLNATGIVFNGGTTINRRDMFNNVSVTYNGSVTLNQGNFYLRNSGAIDAASTATALNVNGGTVIIDNSSTNLSNRMSGKGITTTGMTLNFLHSANGSTYAESAGALTINGGQVTITPSAAGVGGTSTLTFSSLSRSATSHSTVNFNNGDTLGLSNLNRVVFTSQAAGFMGGWAVVTSPSTVFDFAKYVTVGSASVTAFVSGDYNTALTSAWSTTEAGAATFDARPAASGATPVGTSWVRSLTLTGATPIDVSGAAKTLDVISGGILSYGGAHVLSVANLTAGTAANNTARDLYFNVMSSSLSVSSLIKNEPTLGGVVSVVKSGAGTLVLSNAGNTFSGGLYLNGGNTRITSDANLGAVGNVVNFNGGTLQVLTGSFTINHALNVGAQGGTINYQAAAGTLTIGTAVTGSTWTLFRSGTNSNTVNFSAAGNNLAGGFTNNGAGSTTTFTGGTTTLGFLESNAGVVKITGAGNVINGRVRADGGQIELTNTTLNGLAAVNNGTLKLLDGNVINLPLTVNSGTVIFGDDVTNTGSNTFGAGAAKINVTAGEVRLVSPTGIVGSTLDSIALNNAGGILALVNNSGSAQTFTLKGLSGGDASEIKNGGDDNQTLVINSDINVTFSGVISNGTGLGNLGLTKDGLGMLTLNQYSSTYTGKTIVKQGVLNTVNLDSGASSIGGTLDETDPGDLVLGNGTALRYSGSIAGLLFRNFTIESGAEGVSIVAAGAGTSPGDTKTSRLLIDPFLDPQSIGFLNTSGTNRWLLNLTGSNTGDNEFSRLIDDTVSGGVTSLTKTGSGTWLIGSFDYVNKYKGSTTVIGGVLVATADGALGEAGGQGVILAGGVLEFRGVDYLTNETIAMQGGNIRATTGDNTWAGNVSVDVNSTITVETGASLALNGSIAGRGTLLFAGEGTLVFAGLNYPSPTSATNQTSGYSYGAVTVQAGTLDLRYSSAQNKLPLSALTMGGGRRGATILIENSNPAGFTADYIEDVSGLTLASGNSKVIRSTADLNFDTFEDARNIRLRINNITRAQGATLEFSADNIADTDLLNTNNILGAWATVRTAGGGMSWATNSGSTTVAGATVLGPGVGNGLIRGLADAAYTINLWPGSTTNTTVDGTFAGMSIAANSTTYTLRFNHAGNDVQTLLGGNNVIQSGGILITGLVGAFNTGIAGPGSLSAGSVSTSLDLQINQQNTAGVFEISAPIITNPASGTLLNGLIKLGDGLAILSGANTYDGVTVLNEGTLSIESIANGNQASNLGRPDPTNVQTAATLVSSLSFNGGTLSYTGEVGTTNRGFTNNNEAIIEVTREAASLAFRGQYATPTTASEYAIRKIGSGTLVMSGTLLDPGTNLYGLTNWIADDGTTQLVITNNNQFARSGDSFLTVQGGTFELKGINGDTAEQDMPGQFVVGSGASVVKVTAVTGSTTSLNLQDSTGDVARSSGGTVLFQENPTGNGVANIRLSLPGILSQVIIPWATYQDTSNLSQPGVNEFATSVPNLSDGGIGDIQAANAINLHDIGSTPANAANWDGSILNPSENDVIGQTFHGTTPSNGKVNTLRYFSNTADSTVTILDTLTLTQGAILVAAHVGNVQKTITGGTLTSGLVSGQIGSGVFATTIYDLLIHNYNIATQFEIGADIVDPLGLSTLALVQTGTGTTKLTGNNTYSSNTFVSGGVLLLGSANALSANSNLVLDQGVLGLGVGDFSQSLGTGAGQFRFNASGGFAAYGADRTVDIGGGAGAMTWGGPDFVPNGDFLILGANDADKTLTLVNPLLLGAIDRVVKVNDGTAAIDGVLSGNMSSFGGGLIKVGYGTLQMTGTNSYTGGTVLANGRLIIPNEAALGSPNSGTPILSIGTTVESTPDDFTTLVYQGATLTKAVVVGAKNSMGPAVIENTVNLAMSGNLSLNRTFQTAVDVNGSPVVRDSARVFLKPDSGTTATYSGTITGTGGFTVVGGGILSLTNAANNYATDAGYGTTGNAINGGTVLRSGTVQVWNSGSLGTTTVELGDAMSVKSDVQWSTRAGISVVTKGGIFDANSDGFATNDVGPGAFLNISSTLDGHTFTAGDIGARILIKDENSSPESNGIYEVLVVNGDGTMNLVRTSDFSVPGALGNMTYGSQVTVTNASSLSDGLTFFNATPDVQTSGQANSDPSEWMADTSNPNVALLAKASGIAVLNDIDVNATNGTGTSTIGGDSTVTGGPVTFSGKVTLRDTDPGTPELKTLFLTSATSVSDGVTFSGVISEASGAEDVLSLTATGGGVVTLSNTLNTFHGQATVLSGNILRVTSSGALGAATGSASSGTVVNSGGALELVGAPSLAIGNEALTLNGTGISNGGALRNVSGTNTFGGTVTLAADSLITSVAGSLTLSNATSMSFAGGTGKNLSVDGAGDLFVSGVVATGTGSITKGGAGLLALNGNNSFTGGLNINAGVVRLGNAGALNSTTPNAVVFGAGSTGTLRLNGQTVTVASLDTNAVLGSPVVENANAAPATLTVKNAVGTSTYGGVIRDGSGGGALAFKKDGAGTFVVTGNSNTYSGGTTVTAGKMLVNNSSGSGTGTGAVTVGNGVQAATLGGTGVIAVSSGGSPSFTLNANSFITPGADSPSGGQSLSISTSTGGAIVLNGTLQFSIFGESTPGALNPTSNNTKLIFTGSPTVTLGATSKLSVLTSLDATLFAIGSRWDILDWATAFSGGSAFSNLPGSSGSPVDLPTLGAGKKWDWSNLYSLTGPDAGSIRVVAVPEPGRFSLLMLGFAALLFRRRRASRKTGSGVDGQLTDKVQVA